MKKRRINKDRLKSLSLRRWSFKEFSLLETFFQTIGIKILWAFYKSSWESWLCSFISLYRYFKYNLYVAIYVILIFWLFKMSFSEFFNHLKKFFLFKFRTKKFWMVLLLRDRLFNSRAWNFFFPQKIFFREIFLTKKDSLDSEEKKAGICTRNLSLVVRKFKVYLKEREKLIVLDVIEFWFLKKTWGRIKRLY